MCLLSLLQYFFNSPLMLFKSNVIFLGQILPVKVPIELTKNIFGNCSGKICYQFKIPT